MSFSEHPLKLSFTDFTFLVGAFINKRARLLQSLVFLRQTQSDNFCSTKRIRGKRIQVIAKGPPFQFLLFKRNIQNRMRLKGPPFHFFFGAMRFFANFSCLKRTPSILLKSRLVISGIKRHIRTFDVISDLYCIFVRRRRRSENKSFSWKLPTHISNLRFLSLRYGADFRRSRLVTLSQNYQAR